MTNTDTGVVAADFTQILNDMGRSVTHKVVTKTTDSLTGEETTSFATGTSQTVVFFLEENRYIWDNEGLLQVGDAYVIAPPALGFKRYDQIIIDSQTYYIENATSRHVLGTSMCTFCTLFKVA